MLYKAVNQSGKEMNDGKPEWYTSLNPNERRIIDIFVETECRFLVSRPDLEKRLCKTKLMNQRTLTDRLDYLIERGYIGKLKGKKGAVFYAPRPVIDMALKDSLLRLAIDTSSPKHPIIIPMPVKVKGQRVSAERACELLVRSAETWEKTGVGSKKEKVYRELRRVRRQLVRKKQAV